MSNDLVIAIVGIIGIILGAILKNIFDIINQKANQKIKNIEKLQKHMNEIASVYILGEQYGVLVEELQTISRNHKFLSIDDLINSNQQILNPSEKSKIQKFQEINKEIDTRDNNILLETISIIPLIPSIGKKSALIIRDLMLNQVDTIDQILEYPNPTVE